MTRLLAVADEVAESLFGEQLRRLQPDLILSCGDLPFEYLENLVSRTDRPLLYVPGNHDPDLRPVDQTWRPLSAETPQLGPAGCQNLDGRTLVAGGLLLAGLGGCMRYRPGPNQYSEAQMGRRALGLEVRVRLAEARHRRQLDVLLCHAPPLGCGDLRDAAHRGFAAVRNLIGRLRPRLVVHGHIHPYGRPVPAEHLGDSEVVNAVPYRLLEL